MGKTLVFRGGGHYHRAMNLEARLGDWLSLRPALVHIYRDRVPVEGANIVALPGGNHFAWFLEEGEATVTANRRTVTARAGQWLIAAPGARTQKFSADARIISIQFQAKWPDGCQLFEEGLSLVVDDAEAPRLRTEALSVLEALEGVFDCYPTKIRLVPIPVDTYLTMQHRGLGFIVELARVLLARGLAPSRVGQTDERLLATLRTLEHWPLEAPLENLELVRSGALSLEHLSRKFKAAFGLSPRKYMENRRLDFARRMLAHSPMPTKEVASRLGFSSLSDFSTWFKRHHHVSPNQYRKVVGHLGHV